VKWISSDFSGSKDIPSSSPYKRAYYKEAVSLSILVGREGDTSKRATSSTYPNLVFSSPSSLNRGAI